MSEVEKFIMAAQWISIEIKLIPGVERQSLQRVKIIIFKYLDRNLQLERSLKLNVRGKLCNLRIFFYSPKNYIKMALLFQFDASILSILLY